MTDLEVKDNDFMEFMEEDDKSIASIQNKPWKIIIADDEEEVHAVTQMVLEDVVFEDRRIEFLSSYSGESTIELLKNNPDVAIILLDVVMEKDDSGLYVARYIREELKNQLVRIILRTGQPGQAPERKVITEYDINDYKEKTELTAQKLYTSVLSSLRAYRDLKIIDESKKGLEKILISSSTLFESQTFSAFTQNILLQLSDFIKFEDFSDKISGMLLTGSRMDDLTIKSATGKYQTSTGENFTLIADTTIKTMIKSAIDSSENSYVDNTYTGIFSRNSNLLIMYLEGVKEFSDMEKNLIKIFTNNISIAYDNLLLNQEIIDTQKEVVLTLGEVVETRSKETAFHVKRVAEISRLLALKLKMSEDQAELLRMASPMHDVGKIGIPDAVLNKPGKLTTEEFEMMKKHTTIGYEILKSSNRKILQAASLIALHHHEWWNGNGYPSGLKEDKIGIFGRITAISDVFDALLHKRTYKDSWPIEKVLEYIKSLRGTQFDPEIVDIFFDNLSYILDIMNTYRD